MGTSAFPYGFFFFSAIETSGLWCRLRTLASLGGFAGCVFLHLKCALRRKDSADIATVVRLRSRSSRASSGTFCCTCFRTWGRGTLGLRRLLCRPKL
ncbi:GSCOCG00002839001-RA-CDS [Cotesia congregata]|nr:GSCOCG00002839001-RA-CDS [Cotesia congregata]